MDAMERFAGLAGLLCEPTRARMLWNLLDGRAYTAGELALAAGISPSAASNHLARLTEAGMLKAEVQGRHRYYSFSDPDVAYVAEALASLAGHPSPKNHPSTTIIPGGVKYCRTCYDHLAGYVSIKLVEAMQQKKFLKTEDKKFIVTEKGWEWMEGFGIYKKDFASNRRPLTRQCLDWSERKPHLAGQLGAVLLHKMFERKWFRRVAFSRELVVTPRGRQELYAMLGISL